MADFLAKYGIKEVADITFYHINDTTNKPDYPMLYIDTAKVSTIEQTAEQTEARGGKGNPPLIIWDYGKEINVTLEDALFSAKSMAIMFGNGSVKTMTSTSGSYLIMRTEEFIATVATTTASASDAGWKASYEGPNGKTYVKQNPKFYDYTGATVSSFAANTRYFCSYDLVVDPAKTGIIEIGASTFPGTYYVTGDTYARSAAYGEDEFFQFIIPKAKMNAENTITLEAEGDPSVFNMSLRVMRPDDGIMMKLVKYDLANGTDATVSATSDIIHNHTLNGTNA